MLMFLNKYSSLMKYQLLLKPCVYLCTTVRNIQYWPFIAGFHAKNIYCVWKLDCTLLSEKTSCFILKYFRSWILPAIESRKGFLICISPLHNVQVWVRVIRHNAPFFGCCFIMVINCKRCHEFNVLWALMPFCQHFKLRCRATYR